MEISRLVQQYEDAVISLRRDFHRHPELSNQESRTSARVCEELDKLGIPTKSWLLMPAELSRSLQMPDTVTYDLRVPPGGLESAVARLGEALPQATVLNLEAYLTRDAQAYHDLFIFAAAMAGLALLAGALLLANTVGLAMLDRRYEMGVLKAVGYARRHILASLAAEYSLVAVLVSGLGLLAVRGFLFAWATQNALVEKLFLRDTLADFGIVLGSTLLTLLTVLIVSWGAVHSSPLVVLNEQG